MKYIFTMSITLFCFLFHNCTDSKAEKIKSCKNQCKQQFFLYYSSSQENKAKSCPPTGTSGRDQCLSQAAGDALASSLYVEVSCESSCKSSKPNAYGLPF